MGEPARSFDAQRRLTGRKLGRYQIGARLGVGGSAAVYLARLLGPMSFERLVALKVVHEHLSEEREFISQFLDEANLLTRVAHPNIVQMHELGREGDTLFLAMEYLHGQPLSRVMSALVRRGKHLPPAIVAWLGARVASGLGFAHRLADEQGNSLGLVHRDVSPQNVFVNYDGAVKLIDFGIARAKGRIAQTTLGRVKGKFSYMAPEQVLGRDFDHRADIFALGATLYEAAIGGRLFTGADESETLQKLLFEEVPDPRTRMKDFPSELAEILARTLAQKPGDRYPDAESLARDLDAFVASSGARDVQAELAGLLKGLFENERAEQLKAIEELRAQSADTVPPPADEPGRMRVESGYRTLPAPAPRRRLAIGVVIGIAALVGVGLVAQGLSRASSSPAPSSSAAPLSTVVSVEIVTQPDVNADITLDGRPISGKRAAQPRGTRALELVVKATGFETARLSLVPDRDRTIVVPLVKRLPPAVPAPEPSTKPARASDKAGTTKVREKKKGGDPLVTHYPF